MDPGNIESNIMDGTDKELLNIDSPINEKFAKSSKGIPTFCDDVDLSNSSI